MLQLIFRINSLTGCCAGSAQLVRALSISNDATRAARLFEVEWQKIPPMILEYILDESTRWGSGAGIGYGRLKLEGATAQGRNGAMAGAVALDLPERSTMAQSPEEALRCA